MRTLLSVLSALCLITSATAGNYPDRADYLWWTQPDHADWIYKCGEKATVDVSFSQYGIVPEEAVVEYTVGDDILGDDQSGKVTLRNGHARISMGTRKTPGFRDLRLKVTVPDLTPGALSDTQASGKTVTYSHHIKLAFSPEKIQPWTKEPADFKAFWDESLKEAAQYPLHYTMEPAPEFSTELIETFLVRLDIDRKHHAMYGYLMVPKGKKWEGRKLPVLLCPPGAGVKEIKNVAESSYYAENGIIRFLIEIHGADPTMSARSMADVRSAFQDYLKYGIHSREQYYMRHVYLGLVRSLDFLTQLPQWDGKNLIVQGGSQGGALSIVAAALDPRVTLCVVNHPALADMGAGADNLTSGYPHFRPEDGAYSKEGLRTLAYYDVVNFARYVKCPTYMTWGYNDNTCTPTTSYAVWNTLSCPKVKLVTPINEHWTSKTTNIGQMQWILRNLK
jgi:cephalosporin-C deacetylase-like acetyl esterase